VLVSGASGFIGSRLTPALIAEGREVRALTRHPGDYVGPALACYGDVHQPESLADPLRGCSAAYYLVHSLGSDDFVERDAEAAHAFGQIAAAAGLEQIIYLGGLGSDDDQLSAHLRSRRTVEGLLAGGGVPVTVLRAGIVVGDGGISWEITRQLVENLPAMVTPRWVNTLTQPIAVDDVIRYLIGVLGNPDAEGRTFEIGGPDVLSYKSMLERVARIAGRPRPIVPVPLLSPALSSRWLALVTDVDRQTGRSLIGSMTNEVVVHDDAIRTVVPFEPMTYDEAVRRALGERRAERSVEGPG
jgi:uncharacterized protein YbjT (DUF2867 family)